MDIVLKVPDKDCLGCVFLDVDYLHNYSECNLFNEKLWARVEYGSIDEASIRKCDKCNALVAHYDWNEE